LAAGLHPDPLGELKCSLRSTSRDDGGLLLRGGEGVKEKEWEGEKGRVRKYTGKERRGRGEEG